MVDIIVRPVDIVMVAADIADKKEGFPNLLLGLYVFQKQIGKPFYASQREKAMFKASDSVKPSRLMVESISFAVTYILFMS